MSQQQSGEPTADTKNEGLKSANSSDGAEVKRARSIHGGDNAAFDEEDMDENEIQQAGGNNKGGQVPGAFGRNDSAVKSGGQGTISDGM